MEVTDQPWTMRHFISYKQEKSPETKHWFLPYIKTPLSLRVWCFCWVFFSKYLDQNVDSEMKSQFCSFRWCMHSQPMREEQEHPVSHSIREGRGAAVSPPLLHRDTGQLPPKTLCSHRGEQQEPALVLHPSLPPSQLRGGMNGLYSTGKTNTKGKHSPLNPLPLCQPTGSMKCFSQHVTKINRHWSQSLSQQDSWL